MGTKLKPGNYDCYANALPDEPMFILLARDPDAPTLVDIWADWRELRIGDGSRPESDRSMVEEARQCARNMREWRAANDGKWRHPKEPTPMTDLAELRAIAEQATAGPWEASHRLDSIGRPIKNGCYVILQRGTNKREDFFIAEMPFGAVRSADKREHDANARHIAAFSPPVALAFVTVAEAAQAAFDQPHIAASAAMKPVRTALVALEAALKETR